MWILDLLPGVTRPVVLLSAMLAFAVALVGVWLAMLFVQFGVITAFAMGGGAMVLYWSGVSWILYGYVCVPVEAMAEFQGKHWTAFFIAAAAPLVLVLLLARTVAERGGM